MQSKLGYLLADEILLPLSAVLNRCLKPHDLLIPSSEGRFILLLYNTGPEEAKSFAELLRSEAQRHRFKTKNGEFHLTVSIVYSSIRATESAFNKTIDAAIKTLSQEQTTTNLILALIKENL
jgi:GGDEF domain-containing protein